MNDIKRLEKLTRETKFTSVKYKALCCGRKDVKNFWITMKYSYNDLSYYTDPFKIQKKW